MRAQKDGGHESRVMRDSSDVPAMAVLTPGRTTQRLVGHAAANVEFARDSSSALPFPALGVPDDKHRPGRACAYELSRRKRIASNSPPYAATGSDYPNYSARGGIVLERHAFSLQGRGPRW